MKKIAELSDLALDTTTGIVQKDTYLYYNSNWKPTTPPIPPVTSVNAKPGITWMSLSWTPPAGGLQGNLAGYVVCRSAVSPPQTLADPSATIVYVGIGTHFGDPPLSNATSDLMLTADLGLSPSTSYWYSVFVVTTIKAPSTFGYISAPLSIQVSTLPESAVENYIKDENLKNITPDLTGSGRSSIGAWTLCGFEPNSGLPTTATASELASYTPGTNGGDMLNPTITDFIRFTTASSTLNSVIYQTIPIPDGLKPGNLVPGTIYSASFWYRVSNPVTFQEFTGSSQAYVPQLTVYGNSEPIPASSNLGVFQIEQSIQNELFYGATGACTKAPPSNENGLPCTLENAKNGNKVPEYGMGFANYAYNSANIFSFWTQGGVTFTIGSSKNSNANNVHNAYNYVADTSEGDFIQTPTCDGTDISLGDSFTLQIIIPSTAAGSTIPATIDIANVQVVAGLPITIDPYNSISPGTNLIPNGTFLGLYTPTLGAVSPPWIYVPAAIQDPCDAKNQIPCGYKNLTIPETTSCTGAPPNVTCTGSKPNVTCTSNQLYDPIACGGGAILCLSDKYKQFYPQDNNNQPIIPSVCTPYPDTTADSYIVLSSACNSTSQVELKNFAGNALAPTDSSQTYTLTFDCMAITTSMQTNCGITPDFSKSGLSIGLTDLSGNTISSSQIPLNDMSTTGFTTQKISFTTSAYVNLQVSFSIYKALASGMQIAITNVSLKALGGEISGIQHPIPVIFTPLQTTTTTPNNSIVWRMPAKDPSIKNVEPQLLNETAYLASNTNHPILAPKAVPIIDKSSPLGAPQGLILCAYFAHTGQSDDPYFIDIVTDNDPYLQNTLKFAPDETSVLQITLTNITTSLLPPGIPLNPSNGKPNTNMSAFPMSNGYYGSGQWDLWVKLATVTDPSGTTHSGPGKVYNPLGCCFAFWVFHYMDYSVPGGPKSLLEAGTIRNTEIDIEMNGACPDQSTQFGLNVGRLNAWGGQWGGDGNNMTIHTLAPNNINLDDGQYHKISILFHSGVDLSPDEIDPNGTYPNNRQPGFIKWFIDDIEWGCGWTGNSYGYDNVPITAPRIVVAPWYPGGDAGSGSWAGGCACNTPNISSYTETTEGCPGKCPGCDSCCNTATTYKKCSDSGAGTACKNCAGCDDSTGTAICTGCLNNCEACTPDTCSTPACSLCPGCKSGLCNTSGICPYPQCNWGAATFYLAQMQFTPITIDNPNHTTLPINPQSTATPKQIGPPNRNRWLAELNPQTSFIKGI